MNAIILQSTFEILGIDREYPQDGEVSIASGIATEIEAHAMLAGYADYWRSMRIVWGGVTAR